MSHLISAADAPGVIMRSDFLLNRGGRGLVVMTNAPVDRVDKIPTNFVQGVYWVDKRWCGVYCFSLFHCLSSSYL